MMGQGGPYPNKYESIDELIGRIEGIERTLLIDKDNDSLLNIIEKIALIPDTKLLLVEPIVVPCADSPELCHPSPNVPSKVSYITRPKVKGVLSVPDVFAKLMSNQTV